MDTWTKRDQTSVVFDGERIRWSLPGWLSVITIPTATCTWSASRRLFCMTCSGWFPGPCPVVSWQCSDVWHCVTTSGFYAPLWHIINHTLCNCQYHISNSLHHIISFDFTSYHIIPTHIISIHIIWYHCQPGNQYFLYAVSVVWCKAVRQSMEGPDCFTLSNADHFHWNDFQQRPKSSLTREGIIEVVQDISHPYFTYSFVSSGWIIWRALPHDFPLLCLIAHKEGHVHVHVHLVVVVVVVVVIFSRPACAW